MFEAGFIQRKFLINPHFQSYPVCLAGTSLNTKNYPEFYAGYDRFLGFIKKTVGLIIVRFSFFRNRMNADLNSRNRFKSERS